MITRRSLGYMIASAAWPGVALAQGDEGPPLPPRLEALSDVALATPAGDRTTLGAQLRPGPAVVSFWATWCAPCAAEARHLSRMRERIPPARLNIIGVNVDRSRDEARIADFLSRARVNYTQLRGDLAAYQAFGGEPQIVLPRLFVFDAEGRPVAAFGRYGFGTLRDVDRAVERTLS